MADNRFAEALMSLGDTVNQAFGGKQNIYGSYQEQKQKRMALEAEQARLKAQAEATALYRAQQLAMQQQKIDIGQQRMGIDLAKARTTELGGLPERGLRPVRGSDVMQAPIGPGMTPDQAQQRVMAREANRALYRGSEVSQIPSADGTYARFIQDSKMGNPKAYLKQGEARRAFEKSGGVIPINQIGDMSNKTGLDVQSVVNSLGLKPDANGNYVVPAGWVAMTSEIGRNKAREESRIYSPTEAKTISQAEALVEKIDALNEMVGTSAEGYAALPYGGGNEKAQMFQSYRDDIRSTLVYLRSGAAINEQEFKRLNAQLPGLFRRASVDKDQLKRFKKEFSSIMNRVKSGARWDSKSKSFSEAGSAASDGFDPFEGI